MNKVVSVKKGDFVIFEIFLKSENRYTASNSMIVHEVFDDFIVVSLLSSNPRDNPEKLLISKERIIDVSGR